MEPREPRRRFTARRKAIGHSQESLANNLGIQRSTVARWERGETDPTPTIRPFLASVLEVSLEDLTSLLDQHPHQREGIADSPLSSARRKPENMFSGQSRRPSEPIDSDYLEDVRSRILQLVSLDINFGGDQSSSLAVQTLRSVDRKLGAADVPSALARDAYSVAGELAEVTGWLLYDAAEHATVKTVNSRALQLCKIAGDRSMELLVTQNMAMHAGHLGRPSEALSLARGVLAESHLSPRLEALFRIREARALAQGGATEDAKKTFSLAQNLYLNGTRDSDPGWAWWINDQEVLWHEAMIRSDSGELDKAADLFQESVSVTPATEPRRQYNNLAHLAHAQTLLAAWGDVELTLTRVLRYIDAIHSSRTLEILTPTIERILRDPSRPEAVADVARELSTEISK